MTVDLVSFHQVVNLIVFGEVFSADLPIAVGHFVMSCLAGWDGVGLFPLVSPLEYSGSPTLKGDCQSLIAAWAGGSASPIELGSVMADSQSPAACRLWKTAGGCLSPDFELRDPAWRR